MLHDLLIAPFAEFGFMRRALVGGFALSIAGGPVGVFLMLRRMSLTGDAMAHAILPGVAVAYLLFGLSLWPMTIGGLAAGFVVAILAGVVARVTVLKEDASLAAFYLLSLALGVTIVSLKGSNVDLMHVLFGSVLALGDDALVLVAAIATVTLGMLALIYRPLVLDTVDPGFLRSVSGAGGPVHLIFLALVVLNLVGGFNALGTLLAVGLMMLPAAASRFWSADISAMLALSALIGCLSTLAGLLASYHLNLAAGPSIVLAAGRSISPPCLPGGARDCSGGSCQRHIFRVECYKVTFKESVMDRRMLLAGVSAAVLAGPATGWAQAQDAQLTVVATFSILGDLVRAVGGEHVRLTVLVPVGGDAHSYAPTARGCEGRRRRQDRDREWPCLRELGQASGPILRFERGRRRGREGGEGAL